MKLAPMPVVLRENVDFSAMTDEEKKIFDIVVKKSGVIRATKPKSETDTEKKAVYVWRMVAFFVSKKRAHQCMPVTADFVLPAYREGGKWDCWKARDMAKELDKVVDIIVDAVPKGQRAGINRWAHALL